MTPLPETPGPAPSEASAGARTRILRTAYVLFTRHGVAAIGIDRIVDDAGVAKATLYRHFRSKDELVLAVLDLREELWTHAWLESEITRRGSTPQERLLAVFDAFDDWFRDSSYEGCLFTSGLLESNGVSDVVESACIAKRAGIRDLLERLAAEAGLSDPEGFARQWQILMTGAIVAAVEGDLKAARRTREMAALVLSAATR